MMSMEMSDSSELLTGRSSGWLKTYWRTRTMQEKVLLVLSVVEGIMVIGFIIGVASLNKEISAKDRKINQLTIALEECEGNTTQPTTTPGLTTSTSPSTTEQARHALVPHPSEFPVRWRTDEMKQTIVPTTTTKIKRIAK